MSERIPASPQGYALIRTIGRGASSVVWEALDAAGEPVAVKILQPDAAGSDILRAFARERDAMRALAHPNILAVLDADVHDGHPWLAMELCRRGSLASYVADGGPLEVPTVLRVLHRLAGALGVAHEAGVVHCDIKPANVMLTDGGEPALGDFGIARVAAASATTTTMGFSLDHVAPELLDDGKRSPRSDVYSLGTTAWQLLVGVPPFRQTDDVTVGAVLTRILRRPLPESERIPGDVLALLRTMAAKDPDARPASMAEVDDAVRVLAEVRGVELDDAALPPLTAVQLQVIEALSERPALPDRAALSAPTERPDSGAIPVTAASGNNEPAAVPAAADVGPASDERAFHVPPTYVPPTETDAATVLVASGGGPTALRPSELVDLPLADSLPPTVMPIYERPAPGGPSLSGRSRRVPLVAASVVAVLAVLAAVGAVFGLHRSTPEGPPAPTPVAVEAAATTPPTTSSAPPPTTPEPVVTSSATSAAPPAPPTRKRTTTARRTPTRRATVPAPPPPVVTPEKDDPTPDPDTNDDDPSDSPAPGSGGGSGSGSGSGSGGGSGGGSGTGSGTGSGSGSGTGSGSGSGSGTGSGGGSGSGSGSGSGTGSGSGSSGSGGSGGGSGSGSSGSGGSGGSGGDTGSSDGSSTGG